MTDHAIRAHAKKSASGMKRRMICPGSDRMQAGLPDYETSASSDGTAQHMATEWCIEEKRDPSEIVGRKFHNIEMTADHAENVRVCVDFAKMYIDDGYEIELEAPFEELSGMYPGWGGIGDFTAHKSETGILIVADWKFGRGVVVEVDDNPQLLTYAVGALHRHHNRKVKEVHSYIVQPPAPHRDGPIRIKVYAPMDLLEWTAEALAALAASDKEDAPLVVSEECRFCKASAVCPAREAFVRERAVDAFAASPLTEDKIAAYSAAHLAELLGVVDQVEKWCSSVREFAHREATAGRVPPGYKLVPSRPTRKFVDTDAVKVLLTSKYGVDPLDLMEVKEPTFKSPAQMEKELANYGLKPKEAKAVLAPLVESVSSGTVLAPLGDPRDPIRRNAEDVFTPIGD